MSKINRDPRATEIAKFITDHYKITNAEELDNVMKQLYASTVETFIKTEFEDHIGYDKNSKETKETENRRNGKANPKTVITSLGEEKIEIPRDRDGSFDSLLLPKREKDLTKMESLILSLYAKGQSTRDIASTIEEIYNYTISHELVSNIVDSARGMIHEWLNRPLKACYIFLFIDCIYVPVKNGNLQNNKAFYSILGIGVDGRKDVLGFWVSDNESSHEWMNIFDEIKNRGVEEICFVSMDGLSGLKEGLQSIYPHAVCQRCIVHLLRNSLKYVASKDYKKFSHDIKQVYNALNLEQALYHFETFQTTWDKYPGAIKLWKNHFINIEQLYQYPSDIRKIMYTINPIESFYSHLRKVTRNKSIFPNSESVIKIFVLRTKELMVKWSMPPKNWHMVLNQLQLIDPIYSRIHKYFF